MWVNLSLLTALHSSDSHSDDRNLETSEIRTGDNTVDAAVAAERHGSQ